MPASTDTWHVKYFIIIIIIPQTPHTLLNVSHPGNEVPGYKNDNNMKIYNAHIVKQNKPASEA